MKRIRTGIVGGAGYTGGEAIRLLLNHPDAALEWVHSNSNAGNLLSDVHPDLLGDTGMRFTDSFSWDGLDAAILCVGHGDARKFLEENPVPENVRIIDLSQDFRLRDKSTFGNREFVYGLPELNFDKIASARNIANPGCFATCVELTLLPLASAGLLKNEIHITATTGSTGAGQKPVPTTHMSWRANNLSVYNAFSHRHLHEIGESLRALMPSFDAPINFIPYRGDFTRGIIVSAVVDCALSSEEANKLYKDFYRDAAFTFVSDNEINLKQVVNTNKCFLHLHKHEGKLLVVGVIDNLLKGASGQAIQNLNIMFGLDQTAGLHLKSIVF